MTWSASSVTRTGSRRVAPFAAGAVLVVLAAGCGSSSAVPAPASSTTSPVGAEPVRVAKVIDGDTLELADGRRVRVLGIDSCDPETVGGRKAKLQAAEQLTDPAFQPVTLAREPGVDLDPTGLLLRYVQLNGADYGQRMIVHDHTGVSAGLPRMSAGPEYLAVVRALDTRSSDEDPPVSRDCGGPAERSEGSSSTSSSTTSPSTTSRTTTPSSSPDETSSASDDSDDSGTGSNRQSGSDDG